MFGMAQASMKTLELMSPRAPLTPCILDDDPEQLEIPNTGSAKR
jgi:hypothetical protein